jgi:hypothetical protein
LPNGGAWDELLHSSDCVGVGILSGMAGGAAGLGAGIALGFFIPSSTPAGAVVIGTFAWAIGGGAAQATANVLTGRTLSEGLTEAVVVGAVAGGVGGALGHGIGRVWAAWRDGTGRWCI